MRHNAILLCWLMSWFNITFTWIYFGCCRSASENHRVRNGQKTNKTRSRYLSQLRWKLPLSSDLTRRKWDAQTDKCFILSAVKRNPCLFGWQTLSWCRWDVNKAVPCPTFWQHQCQFLSDRIVISRHKSNHIWIYCIGLRTMFDIISNNRSISVTKCQIDAVWRH